MSMSGDAPTAASAASVAVATMVEMLTDALTPAHTELVLVTIQRERLLHRLCVRVTAPAETPEQHVARLEAAAELVAWTAVVSALHARWDPTSKTAEEARAALAAELLHARVLLDGLQFRGLNHLQLPPR